MGKKCCRELTYHVHPFCIYTEEKDCHRHIMQGFTKAAPDIPCHTHEYEGKTSCNECHLHCYHGKTGGPECTFCGHIHGLCGKTSCAEDHKHRYDGKTGRNRTVCYK